MVNVSIPLDELAFGMDWIITDFRFIDRNRNSNRAKGRGQTGKNAHTFEPENDEWPLVGPDDAFHQGPVRPDCSLVCLCFSQHKSIMHDVT